MISTVRTSGTNSVLHSVKRSIMSKKYLHEFNADKCQFCGMRAYEKDKTTGEFLKKGDLKNCKACKAVQYCCKEHQVADWENHKKFCKRFRKLVQEYKVTRDMRPRGTPKPSKPTPYPLHDFIMQGDWKGLLRYLEENPSHDVNNNGNVPGAVSPLILASSRGEIECVDILLNYGANFTNEDSSTTPTPLILASWWGHADVVYLLLNKGADVNQTAAEGLFALYVAAIALQPHVVELLHRYGANIHQRISCSGLTPLMSVVHNGVTSDGDDWTDEQRQEEDIPKIISIVKTLLRAGADINARNNDGATALIMCCMSDGDIDKIEVITLLIDNGAMLDVKGPPYGTCALLIAAMYNRIKAVELLIRRGANTSIRNELGMDYTDCLRTPRKGKRVSESEVKRLKMVASSFS